MEKLKDRMETDGDEELLEDKVKVSRCRAFWSWVRFPNAFEVSNFGMILAFFIEAAVKTIYQHGIEDKDPSLDEFETLVLWESIIFSFDYVLTFMMIVSVVKNFRIPSVNLIMRALVKFLLNTTLTLGLLLLIMTFYCSWFGFVTFGHEIYQFYNFSFSFLNFTAMYT